MRHVQNMNSIRIKKGLDIPLSGKPGPTIEPHVLPTDTVYVHPAEFEGVKAKLLVEEGAAVKRGSPLFFNKRLTTLQFLSPGGGRVEEIKYGPRRVIERITIRLDSKEEVEAFKKYSPEQISGLDRAEIIGHLLATGFWAHIKQRPFSRIADPEATPKSIFVNAMNTAPFQPDFHVIVKGHEQAFQAGLDLLTRLTDGDVHLCLAAEAENSSKAVTEARNVQIHAFSGPHPSGNSSVHIHHVDPMDPHDKVWVVRAVDLITIGRLFLDGEYPADRTISFGGPGVRPEACRYYRLRHGAALAPLLEERLRDGEHRIVCGDGLSGAEVDAGGGLPFYGSGLTVIPEERERLFMGWFAPGWNRYSPSRTFLSTWFRRNHAWNLNSNLNGSRRAMVLTGLYDTVMPMNIMVDFLVRAVLAHDTDEAIALGILETDPEDFALCSFICPSKMELSHIIRQGLDEIEQEGI